MHFESPWALLLLPVAVLAVWLPRRRRAAAVRFSSLEHAAASGRSWRQRLLWLPAGLRIGALAALAVGLARPQTGMEQVRDVSEGIAIMMAVDRSSSMGAEMEYRGERVSRLDAVKRVFHDFVFGNDEGLRGRPADLIGMVTFARYADTACPLTLAHGVLPRFLDAVRVVRRREEDGTSIGDGIALAAARLKTAEETLARQHGQTGKDYTIRSKVLILLTDGQNTGGRRAPEQAAELAARWGINIYTIGVGGRDAVATIQTPFGAYKVPTGDGVDEPGLRRIADVTGGAFFRADTARALANVYREIDRLERSEVEAIRYVDYRERFQPWAIAALGLLALETLLACTVLRRMP